MTISSYFGYLLVLLCLQCEFWTSSQRNVTSRKISTATGSGALHVGGVVATTGVACAIGTSRFACTNGVGRASGAAHVGRASRVAYVSDNISLSSSLLESFIVIDSTLQNG